MGELLGLRNKLEQRQTKQYYSFEQWLGFLDHVALTFGWTYRVVRETGDDCWRDYYDEGYSAKDAFIEDLSNG